MENWPELCLFLAVGMAVVSLILWFALGIRRAAEELSGRTARQQIRKMSAAQARRDEATGVSRQGKTEEKFSEPGKQAETQSGEPVGIPGCAEDRASFETEILGDTGNGANFKTEILDCSCGAGQIPDEGHGVSQIPDEGHGAGHIL